MRVPILRLYLLVIALFAVLVYFTSRWTVFEAGALRDNPKNARVVLEELKIKRGAILADDGSQLARSVPAQGGTFARRYPTGGLFAHAIGYSNAALGQRAGLERSRNQALTGTGDEFGNLLDELRGKNQKGDAVRTTLDPRAQRVAVAQLAGRNGAVVALDPRTGAVKVMADNPTFDPEHPRTGGGSELNRATQSNYAPGSTFKVVTAIAAIDSGRYTPSSVLNGNSPQTVSGVSLMNDLSQSFGPIPLTTALTQSVNTVFGPLAVALGKPTMERYMKRLGFYAKPPLDYPRDQMVASGEKAGSKLLPVSSDRVDVGRMGIGQDKLAVTPLQMAMVAAAVANRGTLMRPHLTDRTLDPDGRVRQRIAPSVYAQPMKPGTAAAVNTMMQSVVREGTGTAAALAGIDVAGKTGTADVPCPNAPGGEGVQTWFIAFAPAKDPRIAVAATVECSGGFGGTVAAPIAKAVMQSLLGPGA